MQYGGNVYNPHAEVIGEWTCRCGVLSIEWGENFKEKK